MKKFRRFAAAALAVAMAAAMMAVANPAEVLANRLEGTETFTFRDPSTTPRSFNPHDIEGSYAAVTSHRWYLSTPFAKRVLAPEGSERFWEWKYFAATAFTDITAEFDDKERFGVPEDAEEGFVWVIDIRDDMRWHDGTPITAECYVRSAWHRFNPAMLAGASTGAFGQAIVANAAAFYSGDVEWEEVGLWASDTHQLTFVLEAPLFGYDRYLIEGEWILIHEELYVDGLETIEELLATNYRTTLETMSSSGPFMITSLEFDRQVVFERNPYWFGWHDPAFDDHWHMTHVILDVVIGAETQELLFNQGQLDRIRLGVGNFERYRFSDFLIQYGSTNTFRFVFNSDLESLRDLEETRGDGNNIMVLSVREFREAMSFALDRVVFNQQTSAGWSPSVVLLENYFYDIFGDGRFRQTEYAMRAIVEMYGFTYGEGSPFRTLQEAYRSITGFNLPRARELFQEAYEIAVDEGIYTSGQPVDIRFHVSAAALTPNDMRQEELLNAMFAAATEGTGFEGNVNITFVGNWPNLIPSIAAGSVEAIRTAWGGGDTNPFGFIGAYVNAVTGGRSLLNIAESRGWDPTTETLTMYYDFFQDGNETEMTMTFNEWYLAINYDGMFVAPELLNTRLFVLAQLEVGVLQTFQTIPFGNQMVSELHSMKVSIPRPVHPIFFEFTPRSQLIFNFNDEEWAEFVVEHGGILNYE